MYCECLRKGSFCIKTCNCNFCKNFPGSKEREIKYNQILNKNPNLFNKQITKFKNTIILPHLGASTSEAEDNCAVMAINQLVDYIDNGSNITIYFYEDDFGFLSDGEGVFMAVPTTCPIDTDIDWHRCYKVEEIIDFDSHILQSDDKPVIYLYPNEDNRLNLLFLTVDELEQMVVNSIHHHIQESYMYIHQQPIEFRALGTLPCYNYRVFSSMRTNIFLSE